MSKKLEYNIIGTGSKGNAVRIENVMFDCGVPYKDMKEDLYKCDLLLITHDHGDHIKKATFLKIRDEFPNIRIVANPTVAYQYHVDKIVTTKGFHFKRWIITPFAGVHDTECTYYTLQKKGLNLIYATDTAELKNPTDMKFDYMFLESNYDEKKLQTLAKKYKRKGYDPALSNLRHLSTQKCKAYYYMYRRDENSPLIELHQSSRFY